GWYVPATSEAARRYYSARQFHMWGAPSVATGIVPWSLYGKFFDWTEQSNHLPRPDNKHVAFLSLKKTLEQFVTTPIATEDRQREPRLILVAVDVKTGDTVTFDSYEKKEDAKENNLTKFYSIYG